MEYSLRCTSVWGKVKEIIEKYPVLEKYQTRVERPYPNPIAERLVIKVDNLPKLYDDIKQEIILSKDEFGYELEIYDDYRE